ncbi:MAG: transcriptional repressor NrdR [Dehalococcoidia bacterium]|nr:transcriptional repressor NrdR [Dehalococcoidia bacterium]MCA9851073.1 transcriptional repressor NrdR [Dehalococcoidia bacterium]MCB9483029.1 transcriptional repressor NrdR [Dehalococcoidia bacterium]MCB9491732.1 transcriptional repressor NrdR [Dehalococcoidia bacterium]
MKCPFCGHDTSKVIDSRTTEAGIRRRRECEGCDERFTTVEQIQRAVVMVVKKDGRREEFNREKLLAGLRIAAQKRPLPTGSIEAIVDDIEGRLLGSGRREIPSRVVGEMAITRLKGLDPIAYIRFASVYHQFVSLDEMLEELNRMANAGPFALAPEQARLFEDDMDSLIRGEVPPVREEAVATTEDVDREPVSLDARRAR